MTDTAPPPGHDGDGAPPPAAELVLGLVDGEARAALQRRRDSDPSFAAEVVFWEARLGLLADEIPPEEPPARVWQRIQAQLASVPIRGRAPERRGLWDSLPFWRGLSFATSSLAALGIAVVLFGRPAAPPPLVAVLQLTDGRSGFMVALDRVSDRVLLMPALADGLPADRVHELWLVAGTNAPRSLGTFGVEGPSALALPKELIAAAPLDAALAVSLEPAGGSPTGQPTGPVIAQGKIQKI